MLTVIAIGIAIWMLLFIVSFAFIGLLEFTNDWMLDYKTGRAIAAVGVLPIVLTILIFAFVAWVGVVLARAFTFDTTGKFDDDIEDFRYTMSEAFWFVAKLPVVIKQGRL